MTIDRDSPSRRDAAAWAAPFIVAVVTFAAFLPALRAGFVDWDDTSNFVENIHYRGLGATQLHWMWTTVLLGHYVPLSWMSLGLDYVIWGMNPAGYHLTSLLFHCANAVLLYFVARRILLLTEAVGAESKRLLATAAAFAALLFAVHPLRVESVAWITERRDVLSAFFYLSSLLCYLRHVKARTAWRRWYWLAIATFVCALLSKATAVTLPAVLLILNVYPLRRLAGAAHWWTEGTRRVYGELLPFALLAMATIVTTFVALQPVHQLTIPQKGAVSAYSLAVYVLKTVVPLHLSPLYDMPQHVYPGAPEYLVSYGVAIGLTALAWTLRKRRPGLTVAWLLFVVILIPMLGVHQNGPQIAADRYTYDAAPALAILAAAGWASLRQPLSAIPAIAAAVIVFGLAAMTWTQTGVWKDSVSLWSRVLSLNERSPMALTAFGNMAAKDGKTDEAIAYYQRSLAIDTELPETENNLGIALSRERRFPEALVHYRRAVALKTGYYEAENNLGLAIAEQGGNPADAIDHYRAALAIQPDYADAHVNWGNALVQLEDFNGAIEHYQLALELRPDDADAQRNWGVALARQRDYAGAIEHFRNALALRPDFPEASQLLERATLLARQQPRTSRLREPP